MEQKIDKKKNKAEFNLVKENEILAYIHTNNENVIKEAIEKIQKTQKYEDLYKKYFPQNINQ